MKVSPTLLEEKRTARCGVFSYILFSNHLLTAIQIDMFRALLKTDLPKESVFACTVGASSKRTLATWHLLEPSDVIASIAALNKQENL